MLAVDLAATKRATPTMTTTNDVLSIDFETASEADLKKVGAPAYAKHPSTRVLMMAWAFNDEHTALWVMDTPLPQRVLDHVANGGKVRGWNVAFEYWIWNEVLRAQAAPQPVPPLNTAQLEDTMAAAAYWGLPLSLDAAAQAAGVAIQKDKEGHALMLRMSRPRSRDPSGSPIWWHETDPVRMVRLGQYCVTDVNTERAVANSIPPLPPSEQALWAVDHGVNVRGVTLDLELVRKLKDLALEAANRANTELQILTNGAVKSVMASAALLGWLRGIGYPYDNLRKDTVATRLDDPGLSSLERQVLELRADTAKTSAAKLDRMLAAAIPYMSDPRRGLVNGLLQYYGASRTGRWAGRLIQPQNMPRGSIKNIEAAINYVLQPGAVYEGLEMFFGPVMEVVSSALRGCIVARPNYRLVVADFSQIEARVVAWLAGQLDALDVFRSGEDIYVYTAIKIGGTKEQRQLGKVLVLACGFGMSWRKFKDTALTYGITLTDEAAEAAVTGWRAANSKIVQLWWDLDRAARDAISRGPNCRPITVGLIQFAMWRGHLLMRLPSGRTLCYRDARIEKDAEGRDGITYMGVDQYTRKWTRQRTYGGKLAENATQAVARDVMADALMRVEGKGICDTTLLVHDELIGEAPEALAPQALHLLLREMSVPPVWALGLPVGADGWQGERYKK